MENLNKVAVVTGLLAVKPSLGDWEVAEGIGGIAC